MAENCKVCAFFGHHEISVSDKLKEVLEKTIENLIINEEVECFYFGGLGEFDNLCWQIVTKIKDRFSNIRRIFCLYDPRHQKVSKRPNWINSENYEEIIYLDLKFDYWYTRIYYRNCEMVNLSDFIIFYVDHSERSGASKILEYSQRKKKKFINICKSLEA